MAKAAKKSTPDNLLIAKELILDEQKLVTYISLSKDLCIHVNEAKTLLDEVVKEIRQNSTTTNVTVSYIISGLLSNDDVLTTVCSEIDLETRRDEFKSVLFQHVYGVSQGPASINTVALGTVNKIEDFPLCTGLIKSVSCSKRTTDEIGTLKSTSSALVEEQKVVVPLKKENKDKNVLQKGHKENNNVAKVHETKSDPVIKSEVPSPKKNLSTSANGSSNTKNGNKNLKGIAGFFTKSNSAPSTKPTQAGKQTEKEMVKKIEVKTEIKEDSMEVDVEIPASNFKNEPNHGNNISNENCQAQTRTISKKKELENNTKKESDAVTKSSSKKNNSLNKIKKNAKIDKKRKRVLHVSDSESDEANDPFADEQTVAHESEDEIPPTPSTNTVKITSGILNPKKRRKIVDKTYTDEEGYILTRKEEVYESCSDEEVESIKTESVHMKSEKENVEHVKVKTEVSPKEKKPKNTKKKISPPQKGKQATLMNFFKKV